MAFYPLFEATGPQNFLFSASPRHRVRTQLCSYHTGASRGAGLLSNSETDLLCPASRPTPPTSEWRQMNRSCAEWRKPNAPLKRSSWLLPPFPNREFPLQAPRPGPDGLSTSIRLRNCTPSLG